MVTFGNQIAGLVLELVKKLVADLGSGSELEASEQICHRTYVDDGAGGGSKLQVERFRGRLVNGEYDGTLPKILSLVIYGNRLKTCSYSRFLLICLLRSVV